MDRADIVHTNFLRRVAAGDFPVGKAHDSASSPPAELLIELFSSQVKSRQLDRVSRRLQARGEGFYTIGSSGHEGNAAIAAAARVSDPAFLHYRDAAFVIQRANQTSNQTPLWDFLLSFVASSDDPISGGRHKVLGSKTLAIPPQTSTIASHLPKAVGMAHSLGLARRIGVDGEFPKDAVSLCSFGDASFNHSTAQGAINTACWTAHQGVPLPLVFVCEDNGIGISTRTPDGWIAANAAQRPSLTYIHCDGLDLIDTYHKAKLAIDTARKQRSPVFLHFTCVRLYGHAGVDAQQVYLEKSEIEAAEANDPLLHSARILVEHGGLSTQEVLSIYQSQGTEVEKLTELAIGRPKLSSAEETMSAIIPPPRGADKLPVESAAHRQEFFGDDLDAMAKPQHMAKLINWALADLMLQHREIVIAGEDVGPKGGVYNVTSKLHARFGAHRVINTILDEQSILGLAIGMGQNGLLPIPEIQFLAYLHNAEDQLRGEAATLSFFSNGQFTNPMVLRIAGLGYQKGFGGHFHNDNSLAVIRDIPGVVMACPSNGRDAVLMMREAVRLAREEQRVVVFVEPIALYMTRDLHTAGDGLYAETYPEPGSGTSIRLGEHGVDGDGTELAILTYGNGTFLSRQAKEHLENEHGIDLRIIDLRWLAPLNIDALIAEIDRCSHLLIVDECRHTGSQSEALVAMVHEHSLRKPIIGRVTAKDSFIPLGKAATITLPSKADIINAAMALVRPS